MALPIISHKIYLETSKLKAASHWKCHKDWVLIVWSTNCMAHKAQAAWWLESVGSSVVYWLDYKKPIVYVVPNFPFRASWANFPWCLWVTLVLSCTACSTPFRAVLATWGLAQAMDACGGSSTRGYWDGPVTCNKLHWIAACKLAGQKVPCEHDPLPCLGHATVCSGCALTILIGSLGSASTR